MKALLVYGSKHGSTKEIAEEIFSVLKDEGLKVSMIDAKDRIKDVAQYDLVIIGSAIELGTWLKEPVEFVRTNQTVLKARSVWLFSSGLRTEDPRSLNPKVISELRSTIKPRDHQFFTGSLDPMKLGRLHRAFLKLPGLRSQFPVGDFRDWKKIRSWAKVIARSFDLPDKNSGQVILDLNGEGSQTTSGKWPREEDPLMQRQKHMISNKTVADEDQMTNSEVMQ